MNLKSNTFFIVLILSAVILFSGDEITAGKDTSVSALVDSGNLTYQYPLVVVGGGPTYTLTIALDLERELTKTSIKSFQADYQNASEIYTDLILVPQDMNLTNITVIIENSANTTNYILNYSLERFINYPTSKETLFSYSLNNSVTYINDLSYSFDNNDILQLNYTTYVNVSRSSSLFKLKVR